MTTVAFKLAAATAALCIAVTTAAGAHAAAAASCTQAPSSGHIVALGENLVADSLSTFESHLVYDTSGNWAMNVSVGGTLVAQTVSLKDKQLQYTIHSTSCQTAPYQPLDLSLQGKASAFTLTGPDGSSIDGYRIVQADPHNANDTTVIVATSTSDGCGLLSATSYSVGDTPSLQANDYTQSTYGPGAVPSDAFDIPASCQGAHVPAMQSLVEFLTIEPKPVTIHAAISHALDEGCIIGWVDCCVPNNPSDDICCFNNCNHWKCENRERC